MKPTKSFCPTCGEKQDPAAKFCHSCGQTIDATINDQPELSNSRKKAPKSKMSTPKKIVIGSLSFVSVAVIGFLLAIGVTIVIEQMEQQYVFTATDDDFDGNSNGEFRYIGEGKHVTIPHTIKGVDVTSYENMFTDSRIDGVKSTNKNITSMKGMFMNSEADILDLRQLDTSSVTDMSYMFSSSTIDELFLAGFNTTNVITMENMFSSMYEIDYLSLSDLDTSNVTNMLGMFDSNRATHIDLTSFDTSNVENMQLMFASSLVESLDISSFNIDNVLTSNPGYSGIGGMFSGTSATSGFAINSSIAAVFNNYGEVPDSLLFSVN